ncbi:hypothetical protein AB0F71_04790 [Kitasatospora sp. NPDC028055]|uniref:hypothetical protein n=1 Tax=Kitasatospora sp. NPDC028055 TaxID=3155653 RepID=UPI0033EA26E2
MRAEMDTMRSEVRRLLAEDGITGYTEEQRDRDIQAWAALDRAGGWWLGFFVACQVEIGRGNGGDRRTDQRFDRNAETSTKISASEFARRANTTAKRVLRYYRAWEAAAEAGVVALGPDKLYPGHEPLELPDADDWPLYYRSRSTSGSSEDRQQAIADQAAAEGIRPTMALVIAENPTALRAAIMADPKTAARAKEALASVAADERKATQIEYVRRAAEEGSAKTSTGQLIDLPDGIKKQAADHLAIATDAASPPEAVAAAFEAVQGLVSTAVSDDPDVLTREQRARFQRALNATAKNLEIIDPDDLIAVADDDLRKRLSDLQRQIDSLAKLVVGP